MLHRMRQAVYAVERVQDVVASLMLGLSFLMAFAGVILRYVLEWSVFWVFPLQHYSYIVLLYFGAIIASRKGIHVRVEVIDVLFREKPKAKSVQQLSMQLIAVLCSAVFCYLSYHFMIWAWDVGHHDVVLRWFNLAITKSLPFVLGVFFCAYFGVDLVRSVAKLMMARPSGDGE